MTSLTGIVALEVALRPEVKCASVSNCYGRQPYGDRNACDLNHMNCPGEMWAIRRILPDRIGVHHDY
jgi:hypothetical protein